jgi:protein-S-isoprenylcysteine O-methyltransferase Ste14
MLCRVNAPSATAPAPNPVAVVGRLFGATIVFGLLLFLVAGTVRWPAGWAYLAVNVAVLGVYIAILLRVSPELIQERAHPPADAKRWDKPLVTVIAGVGPLALLLVCGLDHRLRWSPDLPASVTVIGFLAMAAGGALSNYAVAHNRFFSSLVRIQRDRGHLVIDTGPYQFVRHPGYVGSLLHMCGTALALGSLWALVVVAVVTSVLVARTSLEDKTLRSELDGYEDYTKRVRYRLVPRVW